MSTKPQLGKPVHFYNPALTGKVGWNTGYGGRCEGPYHAVVINDLGPGLTLQVFAPGTAPIQVEKVAHRDDVQRNDEVFWDWADPLAKARAAKSAA